MASSTPSHILTTMTILISVSALSTFGRSKEDEPLRTLNSTIELAQALDQLMRHPWALLYYKYIYSPSLVFNSMYDSKAPPLENEKQLSGCQNLENGNLRALNTFGTCVRVFHMPNCEGGSIAIYPNEIETIRTYTAPSSEQDSLSVPQASLGPCLETEFETATFFRSTKANQLLVRKDVTSSRYIPDRIDVTPLLELEDFEYLIDNWRLYFCDDYPSWPSWSNNYPFQVCFKNRTVSRRVEKIEAVFTPSNLRPTQESTPPDSLVKAWDSMDKQEGDVMGFIIPPTLTEFPYVASNVFPTTEESRERWERVLAQIPRFFRSQPEGCKVEAKLDVQFYYRNTSEGRPYGFYYWIELSNKICYEFKYYPPSSSISVIRYGFHWI